LSIIDIIQTKKIITKLLKINELCKYFDNKIKIPRDFYSPNSEIPRDFEFYQSQLSVMSKKEHAGRLKNHIYGTMYHGVLLLKMDCIGTIKN